MNTFNGRAPLIMSLFMALALPVPIAGHSVAHPASAALRPIHQSQPFTSAWSVPVRVSDEAIMSWFPALAVDRAGSVHLAYAAAMPEDVVLNSYDMIEYVALDGARPIGSPVDVMATAQDASGSYAGRPDLLVDQNGDLLMTWRNRSGLWFTRAPRERASDPTAWTESHFLGEGYFSRLLQDADGTLHVIFTDNVRTFDCAVCFHVFHRSSQDRGLSWSAPVDVSLLQTGAARPQAVIDVRGGIHVVWEMARGGDLGQTTRPRRIAYAASLDRGASWSDPRVLTADEGAAPSLSIDGTGVLLVTWMGQNDDGFYFIRSNDRGLRWSLPSRIEGATNTTPVYDARLDGQAAVVDGGGRVHWFAVGRTPQQQRGLSVLHCVWDGSAWSTPEIVVTIESDRTGDVPQWPTAAVFGNQLYAAWYVRKGELMQTGAVGSAAYEVHYAVAGIDAPTSVPVPYPTRTSVPTIALLPTPALRPEPKLAPVSSALTEASMQSLRSEGDLWQTILIALTPLLLLALLLGWVKRRNG